MTSKSIFLLLSLLVFFTACKHDPFDVDTSKTNVQIKFVYLDSLLINADSLELISLHQKMTKEISELFDYQVGYCMQIGRTTPSEFASRYLTYKQDTFIRKLEKEISEKFPNTEKFSSSITQGFNYLKTHLPKAKTPNSVVYMNSLFASNAFSSKEDLGIGLDRYLGVNSQSIKQLPAEPFYNWVKDGMDEKFLERDAMASWVMTHVVPEERGNLAQHIIHWGKILYLTEAAYPKVDKSIILRYNETDFKWAEENEAFFWKYLIDEEMLFKMDEQLISNMIADGPFTPGLPEKAPDRLGQYLGWRMVKNFMESTETSFENLLKTEYNEILQSYETD